MPCTATGLSPSDGFPGCLAPFCETTQKPRGRQDKKPYVPFTILTVLSGDTSSNRFTLQGELTIYSTDPVNVLSAVRGERGTARDMIECPGVDET